MYTRVMLDVHKAEVTSRRRTSLLGWYDRQRRNLPWRAAPGVSPDPYRVWLSEIMLQQTTVTHAIPYYVEFTSRWPKVEALAGALDGDVMGAWAGLGYYARARNLLACARAVAGEFEGRFPSTEEELGRLPGVGNYTAAAIAAIAFQRPANVVDVNVERVIGRLFAVATPFPSGRREIHALAGKMVATERPGDWAQALMDLGSAVCRPRAPKCLICPLAPDCEARRGNPEQFPARLQKLAKPSRTGAVYLWRRGDEIAVERRPPKGLLGGMLGLPTTAWVGKASEPPDPHPSGSESQAWSVVGEVRHVFTHFSLTLQVLENACERHAIAPNGCDWMLVSEAREALPSLFQKCLPHDPKRSARTLARKASMGARPASV